MSAALAYQLSLPHTDSDCVYWRDVQRERDWRRRIGDGLHADALCQEFADEDRASICELAVEVLHYQLGALS